MGIASVSNLLARSFIVFMIAYLWLTFYVRNILIVFVIAFAIMMMINAIFYLRRPVKRFHPYVANMKRYAVLKPKKIIWRQEFKKFRHHMFMRRKVKSYVILGVVLFLASFIVRFNIYYIIFSTLMFSFALLSLFGVKSVDGKVQSTNSCPLAWRDGIGQDHLRT